MTTVNSPKDYRDYLDPQFKEDNIDIKRYLSLIISNWYWFIVALFISISIAYGINRWSEKIYTVNSTLLIKTDQSKGLSNIFPNSDIYSGKKTLNDEISILKSFSLNFRVMKELPQFYIDYIAVGKRGIAETRLYRDCPFIVVYDSLDYQTTGKEVHIKILSEKEFEIKIDGEKDIKKQYSFGKRFNESGFDFALFLKDTGSYVFDKNASNRFYFEFISPSTLSNIYRSKLSVNPVMEDASLLTLSTSGPVAEQEADYLNKLMELYLDYGLEEKNRTADQTMDFIKNQLDYISDSLTQAENQLEKFKLENRFVDITKEGSVIQSKVERIDAELSSLLLQKSYYNYLKDYIDSKSETSDIVSPSVVGITDQTFIVLVEELSKLQQQKKMIGINLVDTQEPIKLIETNITTTRNAIRENIEDGMRNLSGTIAETQKRMSGVENEISRLPSTERQMINIQRRYEINNTVYTFLLEKRAEAGITKASNVSDNTIIDNANSYSASMIRPKKRNNMIIALILGLLVPVFGIILLDNLHNKVIDRRDIEKGTRVPVIGFISHNSLNSEIPVVEKPGSTLAESFRSVRTNLKYFIKEVKGPVISVTSTITGEGKTFISANLASIIALTGKKVLLVGLDLRKPRIHKLFGLGNETGLSNYLIGLEKYEDVIIKTSIENLWYATSGPVPPNPAELIDSPLMAEFVERARKEFDSIILDTPPVAIVTDALLCTSFSDFYIFVVRQRYSSKKTIGLIEELKNNEILKSIGIIINDISLSGYYGYGLRYGYSLGYGYSYGYNYYGKYTDMKYGYNESSGSYYRED